MAFVARPIRDGRSSNSRVVEKLEKKKNFSKILLSLKLHHSCDANLGYFKLSFKKFCDASQTFTPLHISTLCCAPTSFDSLNSSPPLLTPELKLWVQQVLH